MPEFFCLALTTKAVKILSKIIRDNPPGACKDREYSTAAIALGMYFDKCLYYVRPEYLIFGRQCVIGILTGGFSALLRYRIVSE